MLAKISSYILIVVSILLILQEEFLVEKIPFNFFYSCKLLLKTLAIRTAYGEARSLNDFVVLLIACFGKKLIFDIAYYQFHFDKYVKYIVILICIDYVLLLLAKKGFKAKSFTKIQPVKTFLTLASGIADSIGLENLLWRNQLSSWHLPVVFLFVIVDSVIYGLATWLLKGEKKEKNIKTLKKSLKFGAVLTLAHFLFSLDKYTTLISLRRKIPFNSSNVMTFSVGIRLLNCFSYIVLLVVDLISTANMEIGTLIIKDNVVKPKPARKVSDASTEASSISNLDDELMIGSQTQIKSE